MNLKDSHYEACRAEGMTDEEIAADWKTTKKELEEYSWELRDEKSGLVRNLKGNRHRLRR